MWIYLKGKVTVIGVPLKAWSLIFPASVHQERKTYQKESLKYLKLATSKDPDDYLIHFHTALQLANSRQVSDWKTDIFTFAVSGR